MTKPCPYCAEQIEPAAVKCKHCGEFLDSARDPKLAKEPELFLKPGLQCPNCQSTEIKRRTRHLQPAATVLVLGVVIMMLFPNPPQFLKVLFSLPIWVAGGIALFGRSSCQACGHRWR